MGRISRRIENGKRCIEPFGWLERAKTVVEGENLSLEEEARGKGWLRGSLLCLFRHTGGMIYTREGVNEI